MMITYPIYVRPHIISDLLSGPLSGPEATPSPLSKPSLGEEQLGLSEQGTLLGKFTPERKVVKTGKFTEMTHRTSLPISRRAMFRT